MREHVMRLLHSPGSYSQLMVSGEKGSRFQWLATEVAHSLFLYKQQEASVGHTKGMKGGGELIGKRKEMGRSGMGD